MPIANMLRICVGLDIVILSRNTCNFCGDIFMTKNDFQLHKKTKHGKTVPYCTNEVCWYGPEKCWFRNSENEK